MRHVKGFSLVELVVVILLIGILSAVAVPRLFSSTDKAHRAAIQSLQSQMGSTLNVIAGEWLLNGSQNPYVIDEFAYKMSQFGYPDVTVPATGTFPVGVAAAPAANSDACKQFLVRVVGLPEGLVGIKPDAATTATAGVDPNAGKTWVAEFTGTAGVGGGKCVYNYNAGLAASIAYMPNERFAVTTSGI